MAITELQAGVLLDSTQSRSNGAQVGELAPPSQSAGAQTPESPVAVMVCGLNTRGHLFLEIAQAFEIGTSGCRLRMQTEPYVGSALAVRVVHPGEATEKSAQILFQVKWLKRDSCGWSVGITALLTIDLRALAFPSHTP